MRYGRHVLEFPIERIYPGMQVQLVELNPPSPDHAAILYTALVATADRLNSITNVDNNVFLDVRSVPTITY